MARKRSQGYNNNLRSLWNTIKGKNIHFIGVPEGRQDVEQLFEKIMKENFPNLVKEIDIQPQEAQRVPKTRNSKRPTPRHIISQMPKVKYKEIILKAAREKHLVTFKGAPIKLAADFSEETIQARSSWHKIFKVMKTQDL
uniref:L1 transposable element RRM domain-containing protein n=1 Tax=Rousettus aegyptiacus TaxID=9407 RepID=A0A7J8H213_ROUAE|nr:hypothetical protein HJG63_011263 [Rousettus aegyptiacus]